MPNEGTIPPRRRAALIFTVAVAFIFKLVLALKTYGTNDVYAYERFGLWSRYLGVDLYNISPDLNHPPSMLHILSFLVWLSEHTPLPFYFWIRFPGILADVGTIWLIWKILGARIAQKPVFIAVVLIVIAPLQIMISGFHGNTDPVMIFFVLAAVWLADSSANSGRDNPLAGGIAFGMSLCIKVAPVILVPVFFLSLPGLKRRVRFFSAAAVVVLIAWSPFIFQQPGAVIGQVFGYKSSYGLWGVSWLFREIANISPALAWINTGFSRIGTPLVMIAILGASVRMNFMARKPSLYSQVGMVFLLFFTATTGFAVQYLAWLTPWLAELGAFPVALFALTGSAFLLVVYNYWNLGMPWYLAIAYPWSSHQYFQVLCWLSVVLLTFAAWLRIARNRDFTLGPLLRIPLPLRFGAAALAVAALIVYPAVVHMRRDNFSALPTYAEDAVLDTQADELNNLAAVLSTNGRTSEADAVENESRDLSMKARDVFDRLARTQPARLTLRTPENYIDSSQDDYNHGDYEACIEDAKESLKLRPDLPAAWNNISICSGGLGDWDAAITAAAAGLRVEPESEDARANLDWAVGGKRDAETFNKRAR